MVDFNLGVIGFGFIGRALVHGFNSYANIKIYDKYDNNYDSIEDTVKCSDVIFVGVPTPMSDDGSQDLASMDDAVAEVVTYADSRKIIVLRSTIIPGTTRTYAKKYPQHDFVFFPEFLTEKTANLDFINPSRLIFGGEPKITAKIVEVFKTRFKHTQVFETTWEAAELVKYVSNCFSAVKIAFTNEVYDMAAFIGVPYDDIRDMWISNGWVGNMHTDVPGHDGDRGYGGKCLVAGTKLMTSDRELVNIEDIKVGDLVFDGDDFTEVTKVGSRMVNSTVKVVSRGRAIHGSEDHIHMIYRDDRLIEIELKDVTEDDYFYIPVPPKLLTDLEINILNPNNKKKVWHDSYRPTSTFYRLIGLYLAEGCSGIYSKQREIYWSFGPHEEKLADEVCTILKELDLNGYKRFQVTDGTYGVSRCWIVRCRSMWLYEVFSYLSLGNRASNKNVPLLDNRSARSVISGWLEGDGSYFDNTIEGYSDSQSLISSIDTMLLSLGINAVVMKKGKELRVSTRIQVQELAALVNRFEFKNDNYKTDTIYASPTMKELDFGWLTKVNGVKRLPGECVFSIETKSHRYVANNILTHNCFPKDIKAIYNWAESNGLTADMCKMADVINERVRGVADWNDIKGATSKNNYRKED